MQSSGWPSGLVHYNNDLISSAFGEWIEFRMLTSFVAPNEYKEYIINLMDKFGLDLNIIIDPLKLQKSLDQNNKEYHFGVSEVRLGLTFSFDQFEKALQLHPHLGKIFQRIT